MGFVSLTCLILSVTIGKVLCILTTFLVFSAGAGKTKLLTKVVDDVRQRLDDSQNEEGLASFYCDANRSSHRNPLAILRSFVKQLSALLSSSDGRRIMPVVAEMY